MNAALLLGMLAVAQMPEGATVKDLFLNGSRIARSIEIRQVLDGKGGPTRYYTSRTRSFLQGHTLADIESWSRVDGSPIKAIYSFPGASVTATFAPHEVTFEKKVGFQRTTAKVPLPKDKPVLLSQFDPLVLSQNLKTKSLACAIVVPEALQVVETTLVLEGPATVRQGEQVRTGVRFRFEVQDAKSWITLDRDGGFVSYKSEAGLEARVDHWRKGDEVLFEMQKPAR